MPYLIGDELVIGGLHHKADSLTLLAQCQRADLFTADQHAPFSDAVRRQGRLDVTQQRAFSASRQAAERNERAAADRKADVMQHVNARFGKTKAQMFDCKRFHLIPSPNSMNSGVSSSAAYRQ